MYRQYDDMWWLQIFSYLVFFCLTGCTSAHQDESRRGSAPKRIAIVTYVPNNLQKVYEFNMMLYGSWKYVETHQKVFFNHQETTQQLNLIDLIVFFDQAFDEQIPVDCQIFNYHGKEVNSRQRNLHQNSEQINQNKSKRSNAAQYTPKFFGNRDKESVVDGDKDISKSLLRNLENHKKLMKETNKTNYNDDGVIFRSACWKVPQLNNTFKDGFSSLDNLLPFLRQGVEVIFEDYQYILNVNTDTILSPGLWRLDLGRIVLTSGVQLNCPADRKIATLQAATKLGLEYPFGRPWTTSSIFGETDTMLLLMSELYQLTVFLMNDNSSEWSVEHEERSHKQLQIAKDLVMYQAAKMLKIPDKREFHFFDVSLCSTSSHLKKLHGVMSISVDSDQSCRFTKDGFFNLLANLQMMTPAKKKEFLSHAIQELNREQAVKLTLEEFARFIAYKYAAIHLADVFKLI